MPSAARPVAAWSLRLGGIAALVAAPLFLDQFLREMVTEVLIFGIFAMSLDLLIGYTGLVSFGHAMFFGLGAYATVLVAARLGFSPWLGILLGPVLAGAVAAAVGYFCVRASGIAFLMLTMAFSQLLYSVALKWRSVTGGSDGIGGLVRPRLAGLSFDDPLVMYYFVLPIFLAVTWGLFRLVASPLGHVFIGIRENEGRMRAIGFATGPYKLIAFVIAGCVAGLAGGLYGFYSGFVSADLLYWTSSGDVLIMTVLGGPGTLVGPVVGAAVYLFAKSMIGSFTQHWLLAVGVIFVCCVLFFNRGIYGTARALWRGSA